MKKKMVSILMAAVMAVSVLTGCGKSNVEAAGQNSAKETEEKTKEDGKEDKDVLRVGMECAYAPFNWTQESPGVSNGETAVPIYGSNYYAYGYDVMMAKKIADYLGMELEIHKVEWDTIGLAMDSGEYDCIIAGMGKTPEREASYAFTTPIITGITVLP